MFHEPVMVDEVLEYLQPRTGTIIDATVGGGGHALAILSTMGGCVPPGRLLGIDADPEAIASARRQLDEYDNVELVHANYVEMPALVCRYGLEPVTGVLADLGVSWFELRTGRRGFGHDVDGPLDIRFDPTSGRPTARELLRRLSERQLRDMLRLYGEEPMSGRIARVVYACRRSLATTRDLAGAVTRSVPVRFGRKALARTFQALRIAVNDELKNVGLLLDAALEVMVPGGRLVVISYHSLEDRIVKQFMRENRARGRLRVLTSKPLRPGPEEVARNPRSRSARLRAAEVTG